MSTHTHTHTPALLDFIKVKPVAPLRVTISDGNTFFKREFLKLKKKKVSSLVRGRKVACPLQP